MRDLVTCSEFDLAGGEFCFRIDMHAPRANALEPEFLAQLHQALDKLERSGAQKALISGGRNFSTGGDVARFHEAAQQGQAEVYAEQVVPVLQDLVLHMVSLPVVIGTALRGAATGGAAGILFASDLAVAAPEAFVQPYYSVMGFAPDGGWAALLPELIGCGPARGWLMANTRHMATDLQRLGLVQCIDDNPETQALQMLDTIDAGSAIATKSMIWHEARLTRLRAGLEAETEAFRNLIARPETLSRMAQFLQPTG